MNKRKNLHHGPASFIKKAYNILKDSKSLEEPQPCPGVKTSFRHFGIKSFLSNLFIQFFLIIDNKFLNYNFLVIIIYL